MRARRSLGFTLLELLVVVAIIAILATLILGGLASARRRTMIAVSRANMNAIKTALQAYETDQGRFPCSKAHSTATGAALFNNEIHLVYAALRNRRTTKHGGGKNAPYVEWKPEQIGVLSAVGNFIKPDWGNAEDPGMSGSATIQLLRTGDGQALSSDDYEKLNDVAFQDTHCPDTNNPTKSPVLVFVDPWGNPYVYNEWASVPQPVKDTATTSISSKFGGGTSSGGETHTLKPHDPSTFDMYCFGPNGVNEGGENDDTNTWQNTKK